MQHLYFSKIYSLPAAEICTKKLKDRGVLETLGLNTCIWKFPEAILGFSGLKMSFAIIKKISFFNPLQTLKFEEMLRFTLSNQSFLNKIIASH